MKKVLTYLLSMVMIAALAISGTVAYLQHEDSDVNVMTLGNVKIEQHEYQRAEGVSYTNTKDNPAQKGDLVPFVQGQALYPAVPSDSTAYTAESTDLFYWGDYVYSGTAANGLWNDEKLANVMDKMVFVENTGKSNAYVRTLIAFECPEGMEYSQGFDKEFMMNINGSKTAYKWEEVGYITVGETRYLLMNATYLKVLEPGNTGHPSLLQVVMTHNATNEDMELLGDTYEILVLSQAVQTEGFADAATALNAAFGEITTTNHPWVDTTVEIPTLITNAKELVLAAKNGGKAVLGKDIYITSKDDFYYSVYCACVMKDMILDLNGHNIVIDVPYEGSAANAAVLFYVYKEGASLTVVGDGNIVSKKDAFLFFPRSVSEGLYIYGGNYTNTDDTSGTKNDINAIVYSQTNKNIHIYGGTFDFKNVSGHCGGFNVYDNSGAEIVLHEGVLLSNADYYKGSDSDEIHLAEGCTLKEVTINGETWYQVAKK